VSIIDELTETTISETFPTIHLVRVGSALLRIREVKCSNTCSETGYADSGFSWYTSVPPTNTEILNENGIRLSPAI
jgi:hypothetical protein